jgi:two-component system C4-dicarboxylate transport response regulator DctD
MNAESVLVVDDDQTVRQLVSRWVEKWGYAVRQADSATEALRQVVAEPPAIILCDIRMPGQDGFWLVEQVRESWPGIPFIMVTGLDDLDTVVRARRGGAVDYVTKPFGREQLHQALERAKAIIANGVNA